MTEVHLPEGWAHSKLHELTSDISYGYTASSTGDPDGPKMLRITDIQHNSVDWSGVPYCTIDADKLEKYKLRKNDLVFARTGATVGKSFLLRSDPPEAVYASYLIRVRTASEELISLLSHFFNSEQYWQQITELSAGIGQPNVNGTKLKELSIPIPPLAEQIIIADKLDTLLAQVENTRVRLQRIPQLLKRFRQSVLAAGVTGKLTEESRGSKAISSSQPPVTINVESNEKPEGWTWKNLLDLATLESGHTPRKSVAEYWEGGDVPWISLQDIRAAHGKIIEHTKYMPTIKGIENSSARLLPTGTVCFSRDISVGYTTIMGKEMSTTQHFANWVCGKNLDNKYLMYALMAAKDHLTISGQGTTVKTIYMPALKEFRLLTPPIDEQTEIVRRVEQLFAYADTIEQQVNSALARVEKLTQSILAKAFRGELTAEWRAQNPELISGENSAAALLARIKAERATTSPTRGNKKRRA